MFKRKSKEFKRIVKKTLNFYNYKKELSDTTDSESLK